MKPNRLKDHQAEASKTKTGFILYVWRMQESQTLVSILFYSLTLTGIYIDKVAWRFEDIGITSTTLVTIILAACTFFFILLLGLVYDKGFKLWKHKNMVMMKKNVYLTTHLTPKEQAHFSDMWLPILRLVDRMEGQDTLKESISTLEHWRKTGKVTQERASGDVLETVRKKEDTN